MGGGPEPLGPYHMGGVALNIQPPYMWMWMWTMPRAHLRWPFIIGRHATKTFSSNEFKSTPRDYACNVANGYDNRRHWTEELSA